MDFDWRNFVEVEIEVDIEVEEKEALFDNKQAVSKPRKKVFS